MENDELITAVTQEGKPLAMYYVFYDYKDPDDHEADRDISAFFTAHNAEQACLMWWEWIHTWEMFLDGSAEFPLPENLQGQLECLPVPAIGDKVMIHSWIEMRDLSDKEGVKRAIDKMLLVAS